MKTPPQSVIQVRMDTAVKPYWTDAATNSFNVNDKGITEVYKSPVEKVYAIRIPAGTVIYEGPVGYQGGMYLGGMEIEQVFIREPWKIPGVTIMKYPK